MRTKASSRQYTSGILAALSLAAVVSASACAPLPALVNATSTGKTVTVAYAVAKPAVKTLPMPTFTNPNTVRVALAHTVTAPANNAYPWAHQSTTTTDPNGMTFRQCVSYAAWYLNAHGTPFAHNTQGPKGTAVFGDAATWNPAAVKAGFPVNTTPTIGSVAQWDANQAFKFNTNKTGGWGMLTAGPTGHVAIVTAVLANGNVNLAQYNQDDKNAYTTMTNVRAPRYIHIPLAK